MCQLFRQEIENNDWIKNVCFTDEAHFYLNGIFNSQNCSIWGNEVPNEVNEPLYINKCTARCALSANRIIGPLRPQEQDTSLIRNDIEVLSTPFTGYCNVIKICDLRLSSFNRTEQHLTWQL